MKKKANNNRIWSPQLYACLRFKLRAMGEMDEGMRAMGWKVVVITNCVYSQWIIKRIFPLSKTFTNIYMLFALTQFPLCHVFPVNFIRFN